MENPAKAASRLLLSTGLGLLLVTGLALQRNLLSISTPNYGWLIPLSALIFIYLSMMMNKGKGPLSTLFPDENNKDVVERVSKEIEITKKEDEMGGAWAQLEASLLSSEIGEEEE
jgi:hypothetical protein